MTDSAPTTTTTRYTMDELLEEASTSRLHALSKAAEGPQREFLLAAFGPTMDAVEASNLAIDGRQIGEFYELAVSKDPAPFQASNMLTALSRIPVDDTNADWVARVAAKLATQEHAAADNRRMAVELLVGISRTSLHAGLDSAIETAAQLALHPELHDLAESIIRNAPRSGATARNFEIMRIANSLQGLDKSRRSLSFETHLMLVRSDQSVAAQIYTDQVDVLCESKTTVEQKVEAVKLIRSVCSSVSDSFADAAFDTLRTDGVDVVRPTEVRAAAIEEIAFLLDNSNDRRERALHLVKAIFNEEGDDARLLVAAARIVTHLGRYPEHHKAALDLTGVAFATQPNAVAAAFIDPLVSIARSSKGDVDKANAEMIGQGFSRLDDPDSQERLAAGAVSLAENILNNRRPVPEELIPILLKSRGRRSNVVNAQLSQIYDQLVEIRGVDLSGFQQASPASLDGPTLGLA